MFFGLGNINLTSIQRAILHNGMITREEEQYDNDNGTMVIVPEQAEIVKEIFAACLARKGTHAIAFLISFNVDISLSFTASRFRTLCIYSKTDSPVSLFII